MEQTYIYIYIYWHVGLGLHNCVGKPARDVSFRVKSFWVWLQWTPAQDCGTNCFTSIEASVRMPFCRTAEDRFMWEVSLAVQIPSTKEAMFSFLPRSWAGLKVETTKGPGCSASPYLKTSVIGVLGKTENLIDHASNFGWQFVCFPAICSLQHPWMHEVEEAKPGLETEP